MIEKMIGAAIFEHTINRALRFDPQATEKLAPLEGKRIGVQLDFVPRLWVFRIHRQRLVFDEADAAPADVRLHGSLGGFLRIFRVAQSAPSEDEKLHIDGDLHTAQQFQRVMADLSPDFRAVLVARFGNRIGGVLSEALQLLQRQGEAARATIEARIRAVLGGEDGVVLVRESFAAHKSRLARLRMRLERLEERLNALETP